jgi:hypothetical protein
MLMPNADAQATTSFNRQILSATLDACDVRLTCSKGGCQLRLRPSLAKPKRTHRITILAMERVGNPLAGLFERGTPLLALAPRTDKIVDRCVLGGRVNPRIGAIFKSKDCARLCNRSSVASHSWRRNQLFKGFRTL